MIDVHHEPNDLTAPRKSRFWALRNGGRSRPIALTTTATRPIVPAASQPTTNLTQPA